MSGTAPHGAPIRKTALNEAHRRAGGRMVDFAGWDMPIEYSGIIAEHLAVRNKAGLFDVSHMGEIEFDGPGALPLLQKVTCNDVSRLQDGQAHYSGLMNERGGMVDDLLIHKVADNRYFLCVNAARREADFDWFTRHNNTGASLRNTSDDYTQLAIQGPRALEILQPLTSVNLAAIKYYWFAFGKVLGTECLVARTGYTGEDGFEVYLPVSESERFWNAFLDAGKSAGLIPCGLGARNTLRLEAGMLLYGHDMNEDVTPLEAGLKFICKLDKVPFLGQDVLLAQSKNGLKRRVVGFEMLDRAIARDDAPVHVGGKLVGKVTSGSHVPFLKRNIGLAMLPMEFTEPGQKISIEIRGNLAAAKVVPVPFYRRPKS